MGYIHSDNIKVFPTTLRSNKDASARMMTEFNLTSIINRLVDKKCFVISGDSLDDQGYFVIDSGRFEFNMFGYYFSISDIHEILNSITIGDTTLENIAKLKLGTNAILFEEGKDKINTPNLHIVAKISISGNSNSINNMSWQRLNGTDRDGKYEGIQFALESATKFNENSYYTDNSTKVFSILELIERPYTGEDSKNLSVTTKYNLRIPANSKVKFATSSLNQSIRIDDGRLD